MNVYWCFTDCIVILKLYRVLMLGNTQGHVLNKSLECSFYCVQLRFVALTFGASVKLKSNWLRKFSLIIVDVFHNKGKLLWNFVTSVIVAIYICLFYHLYKKSSSAQPCYSVCSKTYNHYHTSPLRKLQNSQDLTPSKQV